MAEVLNLRTENTLINAFPFAPHLSFWMTYFATETIGAAAIHTGKVLGSLHPLDALERFSADTLSGTPGYCYHLLRLATMEKRSLSSLKTVVLGGERVPEGMRVKMQDLLRQLGASNVRIFSSYAFTGRQGRLGGMPGGGGKG